jgi:hypothetical protein
MTSKKSEHRDIPGVSYYSQYLIYRRHGGYSARLEKAGQMQVIKQVTNQVTLQVISRCLLTASSSIPVQTAMHPKLNSFCHDLHLSRLIRRDHAGIAKAIVGPSLPSAPILLRPGRVVAGIAHAAGYGSKPPSGRPKLKTTQTRLDSSGLSPVCHLPEHWKY